MPRMLGCSVCDVPLQNSSFHDTWLCQNKMYKNTMWKMGLLILVLCTLSSNISAPWQKIKKNAQDVEMQCTWWFSAKLFFSWYLVILKKCIKVCWAAKLPPFSQFFKVSCCLPCPPLRSCHASVMGQTLGFYI